MLNYKYQINEGSSSKKSLKIANNQIPLTDTQSNNLSPSIISDTSPVYLFCTSKNGINSKNENGWTPIYRSIIANNLIALNELLKLGSDPNIGNNLGETPLYLCVDVDNYDALIILLQYNADTNISKRNGITPLHLAAKKNKENYISALLRNKANPNLQNKLYSQTPTHLAIINKVNEDMLNIFHEHGADIYGIKDKYDKTPFDYAKELRDEEYINLLVKIFGENKEVENKKTKTFNVNKIPEEINKKTDKILDLNIKNNFHNSGFNIFPQNNLNNIYSGENLNKEDFKVETNDDNNNKSIISKQNILGSNNSKKMGILNSGDPLYSDRSISNNEESIKSKNNNNNLEIKNNNNLSEFQPETKNEENNNNINEIKSKNSLTKILKNNINIDTNMIDNSKDVIVLNNKDNNNKNQENQNKIEEQENIEENIDFNNVVIEIKESNKILNSNNDKELIKNIISSTVKKIKVNTNTFNSEFSSNNNNSDNNSINQNNPSNKIDYVKMINFSSDSNKNKNEQNNNTNNNIVNMDNFIITNNNPLDNGTTPFILYNNQNQKKHENEIEIKPINNYIKTNNLENNIINITSNDIINQKDGLNEITPISNSKTNNNHSGNSNIFSETTQINELINLPNNNITQSDGDISNYNTKNNHNKEIDIKLKDENNNNENINSINENNFYDASLEYSKSKSYLGNDISNNNVTNNNINNTNNNIINQHHRQLSYHNNNKSANNKRKKDDSNNKDSNIELEENIIDKENENPNNNEIIYYNKNYLAGNNTPLGNNNTQKELIINQNKNIMQKASIKNRAHSDINVNDISNIHKYHSITNKTNTINQKIFTYTSPNLNKNTYLINTRLNFENNNENNNNILLNTNPNINISNLNETKDDFFSGNNNNFSSFLNTNKQNLILRDSKNDNSTFNAYDDVNEAKNMGRKTETITTNFHTINNNKNDKKPKNNEKHSKTNFRASSMVNTTLSSAVKNQLGTGKKSNNSTGRNSNTNMNNTNNLIKNIPVNLLVRLRDWLISCDLLSYYNLLIENNMYDIDQIISDIKNNNISLGYKEIEDIGIRKPGHIFRLLLKLEIDSGNLDNTIFNKIISKFTLSCSLSNNIILTSSVSDIRCCGICNKNNNLNSYNKRTNWPYNDIFTFLKFKDLWKYKENFIHNGFDQLEYVLLQLFSKYKFNKNIMNDCLHIYSEKERKYVLNKLYEEKMSLARECEIEYDENENKEGGNNNQMLYNFSYSSSKKKSLLSETQTQRTGDTNLFCNIF